ncbi:MAG TPA: 4-(cytidine 5'-diphospho)-2-C-methyl-D-erythritol kinase [Coriobacteriia bacterium]|nr:4-(cytidine 5'-diphospho)-2-C-methyl-D-erythritol kinase [Coriobacteriia bacterium]
MTLVIRAPAKVNLHLAVGHTRPDGYHELVTVFQSLELSDVITLTPGSPSFSCTPDLGLPPDENLAYRAATAMAERFGRSLDVSIRIEKSIPAGAGLGGASTDAAGVVCGLAEWWGIPRTDAAVLEVARSLGADVPFFLEGGAALYTGRGDVLKHRLRPLDAAVVLVKPSPPLSTVAAYIAFDRSPVPMGPYPAPLLDALSAADVDGVAAALRNTMTHAAIELVPQVGEALALVTDAPGVLGAAVAGSGSTVFGICTDDGVAADLADDARNAGYWSVATRSAAHGCVVEGER